MFEDILDRMKWKTQFKCSDTMAVLDANIFRYRKRSL